MKPEPSRFYHPELDALRCVAFLAVFLAHALPPEPGALPNMGSIAPVIAGVAKAGAFGVDLFFVLSAYLMTALLLREHAQRGAINIRAFYIRRALRIWPLYFVFLALVGTFGRLLPGENLPASAQAAFALFGGNWWAIAYGTPRSVVAILWSVSVEEQFYLALPLAFVLLKPRRLAPLAFVMLLISNGVRVALVAVDASPNAFWMNTFARLDPIAAGMLLAVWCQYKAPNWRSRTRIVIGVSMPLLIGVTAVLTERNGFGALIAYPLIAIACALLVAVCLQPIHVPRFLITGGRISYGLYVFHELALAITVLLVPFVYRPAVALLITLALALASYRWLEAPFLRIKQRFTYIASRPT